MSVQQTGVTVKVDVPGLSQEMKSTLLKFTYAR